MTLGRCLLVGLGLVGLAASALAATPESASPFGGMPLFQPQGGTAPALDTRGGTPTLAAPTLRSAIDADPATPAPPGADLAFGAFQRGYFATALSEAMKRLKTDPHDGAAMALVAEIYSQGMAVKRDDTESARWDRLASEQGNREGTFSYGMALLTGSGVPKDRVAAKAAFEKAAAQGHPGALYNLGVMAIEGDGGRAHDFEAAAADFRKAADSGDIDALFALATLYQAGRGVPLDLDKAAQIMKQAADLNHVGAEVEYGIMLFNGRGVDKDEAAAARYFRRAATSGNPIAENRLARLYAAGRGIDHDPIEAAHWHILARAAGLQDAWLDGQLAALSAADKAKVEEIIRRQLGN